MKLLIATYNKGKYIEFKELLQGLPFEIVSLIDSNHGNPVKENGKTFKENALIKATAYARRYNLLTIAEDSGLEVDSLSNEPGVYSARYGGAGLSDSERTSLLLSTMKTVPCGKRTARFVCELVCCHPKYINNAIAVHGQVEGIITQKPIGESGFGYDPIFWYPKQAATFAMLTSAVKNRISHRGIAIKKILPILTNIASKGAKYFDKSQ